MAFFRYEAVDRTGKVVRGVMKARDEQEVANRLSQQGYALRGINTGAQSSAAVAAPPRTATQTGTQTAVMPEIPISVKPKVHPGVLGTFFRLLCTQIRSGIPLYSAISDIGLHVRNKRLARAIPQILEDTRAGVSLSSSMAKFPDIFPVHVISRIWSGELAGKLDVALAQLAADLEQEGSDVRVARLGWAVFKCVLIPAVFLWPLMDVPKLMVPTLEHSFNNPSIKGDEVLAFLGAWYVKNMLPKSLLITALLIVFWYLTDSIKRIPSIKKLIDKLVLYVPLWGPLQKGKAFSAFFRSLNVMSEAGLTPQASWNAASLTPQNNAISTRLKIIGMQTRPDAALSERMVASGLFSNDDIAEVTAGEKSGRVPEILEHIALKYECNVKLRRTSGHSASSFLLVFGSILLGAIMYYIFFQGYVTFTEKAAEMMGQ